ncbi:MAG: hypothetical protein IPQ04_10025 [Saprospiraceae bacterium]|nr:hypothetical protein [Saprospiraceae bacterium]
MKYFLFFFNFHLIISSLGSQIPIQNVYLATFETVGLSSKVTSISLIDNHNIGYYNNQPFYAKDSVLLYTANQKLDTLNTDIYALNFPHKTLQRITATTQSEYSPQWLKGTEILTCVRVENNKSDQFLWAYPADRSSKGYNMIPSLKNIGYYSFIDPELVALFLVAEPHELVLYNFKTKKTEKIDHQIGRCIKTSDTKDVWYIQKNPTTDWVLKKWNFRTKQVETIKSMFMKGEDFIFPHQNKIWVSADNKIYESKLDAYEGWKMILDGQNWGLISITRMEKLDENHYILIGN